MLIDLEVRIPSFRKLDLIELQNAGASKGQGNLPYVNHAVGSFWLAAYLYLLTYCLDLEFTGP